MQNFSIENQGSNTYLVYQIGEEEQVDSLSLGMIINNQISGFAPTVFTQMDAAKFIKYNISAKVSVKQFFGGLVNKRRLLGVFNGIVSAILSAEEYMIDENLLLLDTEYIFADVSSCETELICLPVIKSSESVDLGVFFKQIMFNTQFDPSESSDYVARIISHLNSMPVFSVSQFKTLLDELSGCLQNTGIKKVPEEGINSGGHKVQDVPKGSVLPPNRPEQGGPKQAPPPVAPVPVPPVGAPPIPQTESPAKNTGEKEISLFYLLQHYNSENAAAYKAQQEAKKASGGGAVAGDGTKKKEKKTGKKKKQETVVEAGFAIPGQKGQFGSPQSGSGNPPMQNIPNNVGQGGMQIPPVVPIAPAPVTPIPVASVASTLGLQQNEATSGEVHFGETQVLNAGAGLTTALNVSKTAQRQNNPQLIRLKNNEIIPVNKPAFRIGKEKSYVDYFIADNTAISRSHANIVVRDGQYFVIDTNSTNHTFVNGKMIPSSTEVEISHGTKLRFANEDFEFRLF